MQTLEKFIAAAGITIHSKRTAGNPHMDDSDNMDNWRCVLRAGRYLAGDWGATVELGRRFDSGIEVGAFATFTDVPFSLVPMAVLMTGAALGSRLGALTQALYLLCGVAGLQVFAPDPRLPAGALRQGLGLDRRCGVPCVLRLQALERLETRIDLGRSFIPMPIDRAKSRLRYASRSSRPHPTFPASLGYGIDLGHLLVCDRFDS